MALQSLDIKARSASTFVPPSARQTLEGRKIIERAKGILMANQGLSEADAFALIKRKSMDMRKSMAEIAQALVLSGELAKGIKRRRRL